MYVCNIYIILLNDEQHMCACMYSFCAQVYTTALMHFQCKFIAKRLRNILPYIQPSEIKILQREMHTFSQLCIYSYMHSYNFQTH